MTSPSTLDSISANVSENLQKRLPTSFSASAWKTAAVTALIYLAMVALTLPSHFSDADNTEFLMVGQLGGIAHPPGYPLFSVLLRFGSLFIFDEASAIWVISWVPAVSVTIAVFCFVLFLSLFGFSGWSASISALWVFSALPVWRIANVVEPFSLHLLLLTSILLCTHRVVSHPGSGWRMGVFGFLWGLSFCNHHTMIFLCPFVVWVFVLKNGQFRQWPKQILVFFTGFSLGLAPIAYFFAVDSSAPWVWGDWSEPNRLWTHLFRLEYGTFQTASSGGASNALEIIGLLKSLPSGLGWPGIVALSFGLILQLRKSKELIWGHGLIIAMFGYVFGFLWLSNLQTSDPNFSILQRFFGHPYVLFGFFIAHALHFVEKHLFVKMSPLIGQLVLCAILSMHIAQTLPLADRSSENWVQRHMENIMSLASEGDVLVVRNDVELFGLRYLNSVQNKNLIIVMEGLYGKGWHGQELAKKLGIPLWLLPDKVEDLLFELHETRRIIVVEPRRMHFHLLFENLWFPLGPIFVIPAKGQAPPHPVDLFDINKKVFEEQFFLPPNAGRDLRGTVHIGLWYKYQLPWNILCDSLPDAFPQERDFACRLSKRF